MAEDPDESAQRELKEETGLTGGIHRLLVMVIKGHRDIYDTTLTVGYGVLSYTGELITGDDADVARFTILKGYCRWFSALTACFLKWLKNKNNEKKRYPFQSDQG